MSTKEKRIKEIENQQLLQQLVSLLIKYQNAGKGHVFFSISGHVAQSEVSVYVGEWASEKEPEIKLWLYRTEGYQRAINELKELFENTPDLEIIEAKAKEAEEKRQREQYEKLKAKFEKDKP